MDEEPILARKLPANGFIVVCPGGSISPLGAENSKSTETKVIGTRSKNFVSGLYVFVTVSKHISHPLGENFNYTRCCLSASATDESLVNHLLFCKASCFGMIPWVLAHCLT